MQNHINYDECNLQIECTRKHLLLDSHYHLYLLPHQLIMSANHKSQSPKYQLSLNLNAKIHFILNTQNNEIVQFGFLHNHTFKYFQANSKDLQQLKELLSCRVMFKEISDFYQPISMLGRGGSSKVYLVQHKTTKIQFASKCVEKRYLQEDGGFNGLFNEIELMQRMNHPKIIHLEDLYEGENTFYLILEHLQGQSLHEIMNKRQVLFELEQTQSIMKQLLTAISYMHSLGIMHRDLKPENIMFKMQNDLNQLKIVDFGLATSLDAKVYPYPKCGTPGYVAPEIANLKNLSEKYDLICDLFSVGCIFFKLLTGKELFPGTDYQEILKLNKKCNINLDTLQLYRAPKEAIDLITMLLKVNPKERINAEQALQHNFFQKKYESKRSKYQQAQNKFIPVFQTQNFQPSQIDDDQVQDEDVHSFKIPVMTHKLSPGHFISKVKPTSALAKKGFKKFQTTEFEKVLSPNSPDHEYKPSLILKQEENEQEKTQIRSGQKIKLMGKIEEVQEDEGQELKIN